MENKHQKEQDKLTGKIRGILQTEFAQEHPEAFQSLWSDFCQWCNTMDQDRVMQNCNYQTNALSANASTECKNLSKNLYDLLVKAEERDPSLLSDHGRCLIEKYRIANMIKTEDSSASMVRTSAHSQHSLRHYACIPRRVAEAQGVRTVTCQECLENGGSGTLMKRRF
ncbi:hypothetical protein JCM3765_004277 [Sporobolomyces pararoseus]